MLLLRQKCKAHVDLEVTSNSLLRRPFLRQHLNPLLQQIEIGDRMHEHIIIHYLCVQSDVTRHTGIAMTNWQTLMLLIMPPQAKLSLNKQGTGIRPRPHCYVIQTSVFRVQFGAFPSVAIV